MTVPIHIQNRVISLDVFHETIWGDDDIAGGIQGLGVTDRDAMFIGICR
jgi:hypothetical protein